jgi:outer membrane protein OmpA-like peptidoglycan-associated protein
MKNHKAFSLSAVGGVLLLMGGTVTSAVDNHRVGQYDFAYQLSGDVRARPIQVFDDSTGKTYFQFRAGEPIPVVLVGNGQRIMYPRAEGPYYVVDGVARDYTLVMGMSRGRAVHASVLSGVVRPEAIPEMAPPPAAGAPATQPVLLASASPNLPAGAVRPGSYAQPSRESQGDWTHNSYATPLRGDVTQWMEAARSEAPVSFQLGDARLRPDALRTLRELASRIGANGRVEVIGRDDSTMKEGLGEARAAALRDALVRFGVPTQNIIARPGVQDASTETSGRIKLVRSTVRWTSSVAVQRALPATAQAPTQGLAGDRVFSDETLQLLVARGLISAQRAAELRGETKASRQPNELIEWDIKRADGTLSTTLKRWGRQAGYDVLWETSVDAPLNDDAVIASSDFLGALKKTIDGVQKAGYPIRARVYSDRVVRVINKE